MSKPNIFTPRVNIKPYEYPELLEYKDAIRKSYWIHTEFNYTPDIQDFKISMSDTERSIVSRCMLAISQIEVNVKRFWGDLYHHIPKPEIDDVGATFADSEVRHKDAYSALLELLGLNDEFSKIHDIPAIIDRVEYLSESLRNRNKSREELVVSIILFSLFIEHISLFSQFFIIMSFNKHKNWLKGISNAIEATSKEEEIHGRFGIHLYNIINEENPGLIDDFMKSDIIRLTDKALKAEEKILDWIYENGDSNVVPKNLVLNYIKSRFNNSLAVLNIPHRYSVDQDMLEKSEWFDEEVIALKELDFFSKRSTDYTKNNVSYSANDLF